jgi:Putative beta-barrel porin-2, OmpL-like. bbp2
LSFNLRGETFDENSAAFLPGLNGTTGTGHGEEFTATAQYALWANVLSRVELRWDHADDANVFASDANGSLERDAIFAGAQLIYSF